MKTEKFIWLAALAALAPTLIVVILILVERKLEQRKAVSAPHAVSRGR